MSEEINYFTEGLTNLNWQNFVMYGIGFLLIFLAIKKKYEPMLLLPIGFGAILVNLPLEILWQHGEVPGVLKILFESGIMTEIFPLLIFISVGSMIDFRPLLQRPWMLIFGIVAHGGIFIAGPVIRELNAMYDDLQVVKLDLVNFMVSPKMNEILDSKNNLHACEYETSLMLYLAEELVKKDKMEEADFEPDVPRDYLNYASLIKLSKTGVWGKPSLGTKEKGEKLFNLLLEMSLDYIEDVLKMCTVEAW